MATTQNTWTNSESSTNYQQQQGETSSVELTNESDMTSIPVNLSAPLNSDAAHSSPPPLPPPPLPPSSTGTNTELITDSVLSMRMLMTSKDVGSVIGKGGMTIKAIREQSGAKINISNGTASERLVTVTGTEDNVCKAFTAISVKIQQEAVANSQQDVGDGSGLILAYKLIIQSSQCGSLIGKGGSKIREIRENTGASVQVAGEPLPNSTERAVTVSGICDAISVCLQHICKVMLDNPPKGPFLPYKPHSHHNQLYQPKTPMVYQTPYTATFHTGAGPATTTQHMRIPNDLIGCVIGRKGSKIHEIRVNSGAQIKIAGNEGDGLDRLVTITGTPEAVGMAQYLINSRIHSEVNSFLSMGMNTV